MTMNSPAGSSDDTGAPGLRDLSRLERTAHVIGRPVPLAKRVLRPPFTWNDANPGRTFFPLEYTITEEAARHFRSLWSGLMPGSATPSLQHVPAAFFADEPMQCINTLFAQSGRLHAGHKIETLMLVPVGATVRSRAEVAGRYERGERQFVDVACTVSIVEGDAERPSVKIAATLML